MDQFKSRSQVKGIAIVDLVLTSMTLWIPVTFVLLALPASFQPNATVERDDDAVTYSKNEEKHTFGIIAMMLWIAVAISFGCIILQIVAAVKLLQATQINKDPLESARQSRFWRNVTIVFTIFLVSASFGGHQSGFALLFTWGTALSRLFAIYVVQKFIRELEAVLSGGILASNRCDGEQTDDKMYNYTPIQED